jgi:hypothetical protein
MNEFQARHNMIHDYPYVPLTIHLCRNMNKCIEIEKTGLTIDVRVRRIQRSRPQNINQKIARQSRVQGVKGLLLAENNPVVNHIEMQSSLELSLEGISGQNRYRGNLGRRTK